MNKHAPTRQRRLLVIIILSLIIAALVIAFIWEQNFNVDGIDPYSHLFYLLPAVFAFFLLFICGLWLANKRRFFKRSIHLPISKLLVPLICTVIIIPSMTFVAHCHIYENISNNLQFLGSLVKKHVINPDQPTESTVELQSTSSDGTEFEWFGNTDSAENNELGEECDSNNRGDITGVGDTSSAEQSDDLNPNEVKTSSGFIFNMENQPFSGVVQRDPEAYFLHFECVLTDDVLTWTPTQDIDNDSDEVKELLKAYVSYHRNQQRPNGFDSLATKDDHALIDEASTLQGKGIHDSDTLNKIISNRETVYEFFPKHIIAKLLGDNYVTYATKVCEIDSSKLDKGEGDPKFSMAEYYYFKSTQWYFESLSFSSVTWEKQGKILDLIHSNFKSIVKVAPENSASYYYATVFCKAFELLKAEGFYKV